MSEISVREACYLLLNYGSWTKKDGRCLLKTGIFLRTSCSFRLLVVFLFVGWLVILSGISELSKTKPLPSQNYNWVLGSNKLYLVQVLSFEVKKGVYCKAHVLEWVATTHQVFKSNGPCCYAYENTVPGSDGILRFRIPQRMEERLNP